MRAGGSQAVQHVGNATRAVAAEKAAARRSRAGCVGEREVCRALSSLAPDGALHLDDRRLLNDPYRRVNIDHLVVGPSGVYVVDAKNWAGRITVDGHHVLQDGVRRDERLIALGYLRNRVAEAMAATSAAHVRPQPLVCFARNTPDLPPIAGDALLADVTTVGERIRRRPALLDAAQITELVELFESVFPPYVTDAREAAEAEGLLFPDEVTRDAGLREALERPVEEWMVWLHPEQASAVRRRFDGPARIRGYAGTGKTCVALHRVAWLASTRPGRFLVTSYVATLPQVMAPAYARLSPGTAARVDFGTVHKVAMGLLAERGQRVRVDPGRRSFTSAWHRAGEAAQKRGLTKGYVQEEIDYVLKGRGIASFEEYLTVDRPGRRARLGPEQRRAVWEVATAYDAELAKRGVLDFMDVLRLARDSVRAQPCRTWTGVLLDEMQDVPLVALQLLYELAGRDRPDGLLLVGDGRQSVYPRGFRMAEAGIDLSHRGVVLRTNYRNTAEILAFARNVAGDDTVEEGADDTGVEVVRHGEVPLDVTFATAEAHDHALVWDLRHVLQDGALPDRVAVLCPTNQMVNAYVQLLASAGIDAKAVTRDRAVVNDAVSVATWHRSKGLEFPHVFVARAEHVVAAGADDEERVARDRRALYVAMTRARDTLWVGRVTPGH